MKKKIKASFEKHPGLTAGSITIAAVIVLVFAKAVAVFYSGSTAVLSTLIDSLSDIGLSTLTLIAVKWSLKPADHDHRYGHGKIEGVSALIQAAFLVGGASFLLLESVQRFLNPQPMTAHLFTLLLMSFATGLSILLTKVQKLGAEKSNSLALEADSLHYSADVWINLSVVLLIFLDYLKILPVWMDPLCALFVAGLMMRAAWQIALKSFSMLLDQELSEDIRNRMTAIIKSHPEVHGLHDLRTYRSGSKMFVSFDIEIDPNMLLWSAHEIARTIEQTLIVEFPQAEIMIHIDPVGDIHDSRHQDFKRVTS